MACTTCDPWFESQASLVYTPENNGGKAGTSAQKSLKGKFSQLQLALRTVVGGYGHKAVETDLALILRKSGMRLVGGG